MRIVVLGGGVLGVTTAYYLAAAGHEVVVVERRPEVAAETSFANAGQISPGYSSPWAALGVPLKALKWMFMKHAPLVIRPRLDPAMWVWLAKMLRNCTASRYMQNKAHMVRLAEYSRDCLRELRAATGISYDGASKGTLQLFRTQSQIDAAAKDIAVLRQFDVPFELLDPDGCIAAEPALAHVREKIAGGLRLPGDETGDCNLFTKRLALLAAELGVQFRFGTKVKRLDVEAGRVAGVITDEDEIKADAYVVALGSYSPALLRPAGIALPVYPVKGYSLTIAVTDPAHAPVSTVMDETYKIAITRLGDRIRVGGTAEIAGFDLSLRPERRATLEHSVSDLFPGGGDLAQASFWTGLRPMTPESVPCVGPTRLSNLYLNTGHGTLGWTMACGSARVLADAISGRRPAIDLAPYSTHHGR